ncbi:MAG TPA: trypsin-like peptidase domain-containing protein [Terriglobales bacterium]|nr:trypsin-like peptidase domain-containing protein [Terriglobales bacterium]
MNATRKSDSQNFRLSWKIAIFCLLAVGPLRAQTKAPEDRPNLLSQFSDSMDELTARVSPAVVQVVVTGYRAVEDKDQSDTSVIARQRSLGSGVIVDSDGYIITNAHVVKGAQRVRVLLTPANAADSQVRASLGIGEHIPPLDAKIIGIASTIDLALIKVEAKGLPTLPFADYRKLKKGQIVLAFGNPEGLENSVTMGIVSAVARQADPNVPSVYIQTDAPINPGNSGGPLVDTDGAVVGINTFILSESGGSQGLGFAIPSSLVEFVYSELRKYGHVHRSIIGVNLQEITTDLATGLSLPRQEGVVVSDVVPDGPAAKAGVKIQDVIATMDGRPIGALPIAEMLVSTKPAGGTLHVEILRGKEKLSLDIPVAEQKEKIEQIADLVDPSKSLVAKLGIFGVTIDERLGDDVQDLRIPSGVIVAALSADLSGVETDLQPGDVIHAVNGKRVENLDGLRAGLNAIAPGGAGVLQVERDDKLTYITFEME